MFAAVEVLPFKIVVDSDLVALIKRASFDESWPSHRYTHCYRYRHFLMDVFLIMRPFVEGCSLSRCFSSRLMYSFPPEITRSDFLFFVDRDISMMPRFVFLRGQEDCSITAWGNVMYFIGFVYLNIFWRSEEIG